MWSSAKPVTVVSVPTGASDEGWCYSGVFQENFITGDAAPTRMCMMSGRGVRFGTYQGPYGLESVISFGNDSDMYKVNIGCSGYSGCLYLPATDTLVTRQHLVTNYLGSLVIYKNFTQRLSLAFPSTSLYNEYNFDSSNPDYIFQRADGYAWPIGGMAASDNGRWLATEIRGRGIGLLDIDSLTMRRISARSWNYSVGANPSTEFAVSSDGLHVAQMGRNGGFVIWDVNQTCGDIATDDVLSDLPTMRNECPKAPANYDFILNIMDAYMPKFSSDGGQLHFFATSYVEGPRRVVTRAAGYQGLRLDYLALGDSYSSGEGEMDGQYYINGTNTEHEKCHTSSRSYPFVLANTMGVNSDLMRSVACSGARTVDVVGSNASYYGQGDRLGVKGLGLNEVGLSDYQIAALDQFIPGRVHQNSFVEMYQPGAITIGIGGNDAGFMSKLTGCLGPTTCKWAGTDEGKEKTAVEIKNQFSKLVNTYTDIRSKAPAANIFVVGYPKIIDETGNCGVLINTLFDATERQFIVDNIFYMNQIIKAAADTAGVNYVDIYDAFGEYAICGSEDIAAMNTIAIGDDMGLLKNMKWFRLIGQESFHPNYIGHFLVAQSFLVQVDNILNPSPTARAMTFSDGVPEPPVGLLPNGYHNYPKQINVEFASRTSGEKVMAQNQLVMPEYSFLPLSNVSLSIDGQPQIISTYSASASGSLSVSFSAPDLPSGFYIVHLNGSSFSGEPVDYYHLIRNDVDDGVDEEDDEDVLEIVVPIYTGGSKPTTKPTISDDQPQTEEGGTTYPIFGDWSSDEELLTFTNTGSDVKGQATHVKSIADEKPSTSNFFRDWLIPSLAIAFILALILAYLIFRMRSKANKKT